MTAPSYGIKNLDHLGLVAGMCQELQLAEAIDAVIPKTNTHHVSHGQALVAMILNGLGFHSRTLHMFPGFFADKPTERLIGPGILPEHLNDDTLGRCLDALYETNVSILYQVLAEPRRVLLLVYVYDLVQYRVATSVYSSSYRMFREDRFADRVHDATPYLRVQKHIACHPSRA